jgi:uncharacterized membrane protein affecting hemolysin expression
MDLMLVLLLAVGVIHIVFSRLRRDRRPTRKRKLVDNRPRQAGARKKVG